MARSISPGLCERRSAGRPAVAQESEGGSTTLSRCSLGEGRSPSAIDFFCYSTTSSSWVPSTSTLPSPALRSRPRAMPAAPKSRRRRVQPITLFAFDREFVGLIDVRGIRRIASRLYAAGQLSTVLKRLSASRTYSLTTSICLSITLPVKRSIAAPEPVVAPGARENTRRSMRPSQRTSLSSSTLICACRRMLCKVFLVQGRDAQAR